MVTNRPESALELKDIFDEKGDIRIERIVAYSREGKDKLEIEIVGSEVICDRGEDIMLIQYKLLGDQAGTIHTNEPASLGLTASHDGVWYKYAIPFDE